MICRGWCKRNPPQENETTFQDLFQNGGDWFWVLPGSNRNGKQYSNEGVPNIWVNVSFTAFFNVHGYFMIQTHGCRKTGTLW